MVRNRVIGCKEIIRRFLLVHFGIAVLNYPPDLNPRYGYGKHPHAKLYGIINKNRNAYKQRLKALLSYEKNLCAISKTKTSDGPYWKNRWFSGLDAVSLYGFIRLMKPRIYMEIGSGHSTRFVRRAVTDGKLKTKIISIDPTPRADINSLCDEVIRKSLQQIPVTFFDQLKPGDILFIDGSHRALTNSDVVSTYLDILPLLPKGVIVGIHDIFWPYDYPPWWKVRLYSEQYVLAPYLIRETYEILLPVAFITADQELRSVMEPLMMKGLQGIDTDPSIFWLRIAR